MLIYRYKSVRKSRGIFNRIIRGLERYTEDVHKSTLDSILNQLVSDGFLVSESLLRKELRDSPTFDEDVEIETLGFISKNRPELLQTAIESHVHMCKNYGRSPKVVLVDSSNTRQNTRKNRGILESMKRDWGIQFSYIGIKEKETVCRALVAVGIPLETVKFALFGSGDFAITAGANRNTLLLLTAGEMVYCADDDTCCLAINEQEKERTLSFGFGDPTQIKFYENRAYFKKSLEFIEVDFLKEHERILGQTTQGLASNRGGRCALDLKMDSIDDYLRFTKKKKILATFNGMWGDCGWGGPGHLFMNEASTGMFIQKEHYERIRVSRNIVRMVPNYIICNPSFCMSTFIGFDNRQTLPPFMPIMRNQDGIWGETVKQSMQDAYFGYLPFALGHLPPDRGQFEQEGLQGFPFNFRMCDLIRLIIGDQYINYSGQEGLRVLGEGLKDLGNWELGFFKNYSESLLYTRLWDMRSLLQSHLRTFGDSNESWLKDVTASLSLIDQLLLNVDTKPSTLISNWTQGSISMVQKNLVKFGELLIRWPDFLAAIYDLKQTEKWKF